MNPHTCCCLKTWIALLLLALCIPPAHADQKIIPDTSVLDQDGHQLAFYSDLVKGHTVAINFIFTTCTTICPVLSANFSKVQRELGATHPDVRLISVSVDPVNDTPDRLKEFAARFRAGPGWSFITGNKSEIGSLLGALGVPVRDKLEHTGTIVVINDRAGYWQRIDGLASASVILATVQDADARTPQPASPAAPQAAAYFPNIALVTQDGVPVHFFDDVLKGKTVLINFVFTTCTGACSPITANLARVQRQLGERVGRDIVMVSITVDPETDSPPVLKAYADKFGVRPGWYFLTGNKANVDEVLSKLGGYTENKNQHSTVLIVGNAARGGWRKIPAVGNPAGIADAVLEIAR